MRTPIHTQPSLAAPRDRLLNSLADRRYFKLIMGGSFTDTPRSQRLAFLYARAGADCIDIAPDPAVLAAVTEALNSLPESDRPVVMVSLPLDPDPHFRKIELDEPACIRCGVCLPACPTDALSLSEALDIAQNLCYGCGRCIPTCPTEALTLLPFQVEEHIESVLRHPAVEAVEIHSHYVDAQMLEAFLRRWQSGLADKILSLCFRLDGLNPDQALAFIEVARRFSSQPVMLQVDGAPMSGNSDPEASRPALEAAVHMHDWLGNLADGIPVTISGGINPHTARWLQEPRYAFIAGVGMGTVARQAVWDQLTPATEPAALTSASAIVSLFKQRPLRYNREEG